MPLFKPFDPLSPEVLGRIDPLSAAGQDLRTTALDVVFNDQVHVDPCPDAHGHLLRTDLLELARDHPTLNWCPRCHTQVVNGLTDTDAGDLLVVLGNVLDGKVHDPFELGWSTPAHKKVTLEEDTVDMLEEMDGLEVFHNDVVHFFARQRELSDRLAPVAEELLALSAAFNLPLVHGYSELEELSTDEHSVDDATLCRIVDQLDGFGVSAELAGLLTDLCDSGELAEGRGVDTRLLSVARDVFQSWAGSSGPVVQISTGSGLVVAHPEKVSLAERALTLLLVGEGVAVVERPLLLMSGARQLPLPVDPSARARVVETFTVLLEDMEPLAAYSAAQALER